MKYINTPMEEKFSLFSKVRRGVSQIEGTLKNHKVTSSLMNTIILIGPWLFYIIQNLPNNFFPSSYMCNLSADKNVFLPFFPFLFFSFFLKQSLLGDSTNSQRGRGPKRVAQECFPFLMFACQKSGAQDYIIKKTNQTKTNKQENNK